MNKTFISQEIYNAFSQRALDLYPRIYTSLYCQELAEKMNEVIALAEDKKHIEYRQTFQKLYEDTLDKLIVFYEN